MNLTPVEIMALLVSLFALIKIIVIFIRPRSWIGVVRAVYAKPSITVFFATVFAILVFYYILQELTIVQVFASMLFFWLLMIISFIIYFKELKNMAEKLLKDKNLLRRSLFPIIVWLILIFWVIYEILIKA